jgi:hypothetical protein
VETPVPKCGDRVRCMKSYHQRTVTHGTHRRSTSSCSDSTHRNFGHFSIDREPFTRPQMFVERF